MKILLVGAGGVGGAFTAIAARRDFFEAMVVADYDLARIPAPDFFEKGFFRIRDLLEYSPKIRAMVQNQQTRFGFACELG